LKYIAFLRGINVSGQKIIKMENLREMFSSFGLKNVTTYIQSGNVLFETAKTNAQTLTKKIESGLQKAFGYDVTVILRTVDEVAEIVKLNPFKNIQPDADVGLYVTFIAEELNPKPKLPLFSKQKDVEIIGMNNCDAFCLALPVKNGRYGFPNVFIEKEFRVLATTRNWTTVRKVVE